MSRYAVTFTSTIVASPAAASETIVATTGPIGLIYDGAAVFVWWFCELTIGTSGVSLNAKLRRGAALTSTLVNVGQARTVVAGNLVSFSGCYVDNAAGASAPQYSLTLTVGSGAAASTLTDVMLLAAVL
jgi:hypothetical protein